MNHKKRLEYGTPEIVDYGDLRELTEGCEGAAGDLGGLQGSQTGTYGSNIVCETHTT